MGADLAAGFRVSFGACTSPWAGQHRFWGLDKGVGNVAPLGECYSPSRNAATRDRGPRFGKDAGVMASYGPS